VTSWVLDLDGVIWLADEPIAGAAAAVAALRARGDELAFVTNNSSMTVGDYAAKLAGFGIPADGDIVSSAMAAARLVRAGEKVLVMGGPGVREALAARGAIAVDDGPADAVMVGFHRDFDYERLRIGSTAVRDGARLIGTNDDATYPTPDGPVPGTGSILAAVEKASGVVATVAGKPYRPMVELLRERLGPAGIVVGDRLDTDGRLARALGYEFDLVLSGVTKLGDELDPTPDVVATDLAALVAQKYADG
jgi:4-nitrophenyl phosphatase